MIEAIASVKRGEVARVVSPGKWKVWREGGKVFVEIMA